MYIQKWKHFVITYMYSMKIWLHVYENNLLNYMPTVNAWQDKIIAASDSNLILSTVYTGISINATFIFVF